MKAIAVFPDQKEVRLIDHPEPRITQPDHVRVRILEVGICGTDEEITAFDYGTPPAGSNYLVIGHESLGEVVEVGPEVRSVRPGDLVVLMVRLPCSHPTCPACRSGNQDHCVTGDFTEHGIKESHGFMTEFVVEQERYLNVVPPALRESAILVEPLTIAEKAFAQTIQIQGRLPWFNANVPHANLLKGQQALILGAGPVALLGAMVMLSAGATTFIYSRGKQPDPRIDLATSIGAHYISSQEVSPDQLTRTIGASDIIYEAVGASRFAFEVLRTLDMNGLFIFTGVPALKGPVEVNTDRIMRDLVLKNQVIIGTVNAGKDDFASAIRSLHTFQQRWPDQLRALISGHYPIDQFPHIIKQPGGIKRVITLV